MRVLLVSREYPPQTAWGGIGTYAGILAPALARAGAEVHVLSVVRGQVRSTVSAEAVAVHRAPALPLRGPGRLTRLPETWARLLQGASVLAEVRRLERRLGARFDVVEVPEWMAEGLGLARIGGRPLVVRLHSGAAQLFPWLGLRGPDARGAARLERTAVRRAHLVTGTGAMLADSRDLLGPADPRTREITCPVRPRSALPPPPGPPRILFAGRFEQRKGADLLVEAMPAVLAAVPAARAVLRGRDTASPGVHSTVDRLRRRADQLGVGGAIEIVDHWSPDAVEEELPRCHVVVVPSRWESFGYVAAEAAAAGRPVVASDLPALAELVADGETGRLATAGDPACLGAALGEVLGDLTRAAGMGRAGARRMAERHHPDRVAELTLDAYAEAISRARRPGPR